MKSIYFVIGLLFLVIYLCASAEQIPFYLLDNCQNLSNKNFGPLLPGTIIKQSFLSAKANLSEIHLFSGTYKRSNNCKLIFKLYDFIQNENPIREVVIDAKKIQDNSYLIIAFSPVNKSRNRKFYFTIQSVDSERENSITFWFSDYDLLKNGTLEMNGVEISGDLRFLTFCRIPRTVNIEDIKKNVILIVIDTLRGDHLNCYGNKEICTPNINGIAKSGFTFSNCYATSDITNPSISSIMTGTYPKKHGVHGIAIPINKRFMTIPTFFKNLGYKTAASVGSFLMNRDISGYGTGVDSYFETDINRNADKVTDDILSWLQNNHDQSFFCFVHYWDPHNPYTPPEPFDSFYSGKNSIPFKFDKKLFPKRMEALAVDWLTKVKDLNTPLDNYKGEISFVDQQIGRIIRFLKEKNIDDNTMFVITSDHGESLGEHSIYFDHAGLYEEQIRIPLIFSPFEGSSRNLIDEMVQNFDIYPTLAEAFDGPEWINEIFDAQSLNPILSEQKTDLKRYCLTEYIDAAAVSIIENGWKLIYSIKPYEYTSMHSIIPRNHELYNIDTDPIESFNLINKDISKANWLKSELLKLYIEPSKTECSIIEDYDDEVIQKLKSLGYIN